MPLTSKQRAILRAQANRLTATVHVGHNGLTDAVRQSLDDAFRATELVKVQFTKGADAKAKDAAQALAAAVAADIVQVIGRTATLFREQPKEMGGD